jgi:glycosyltransferase involved in cell wall biosynthesis
MRWYTCTPVEFGGGPDFFTRDSGLLSRGFQLIGVESMAVMPGARKAEDEPDLIRTEFKNLESAEWWKKQKLDGVVLYAWGAPRFRHVARAIRESGVILILNQDSSGIVSPLCGISFWMKEQWVLRGGGTSPAHTLRAILMIIWGTTGGLLRTDTLRALHLRQGTFIAALYPEATKYYRKLCRIYGGRKLAGRVVTLPHTVAPSLFFENGFQKAPSRIIAIGRWHDVIQKRPSLLMETLGLLLSENDSVGIDIVGGGEGVFTKWLDRLPAKQAANVTIHGRLPHPEIKDLLRTARVYYSPSAYESFNIAAAEALCCGCSVVSADIPTMASFRWFASKDSGTLAKADNPHAHCNALSEELAQWSSGKRIPKEISNHWCASLHADRVASKILELNNPTE